MSGTIAKKNPLEKNVEKSVTTVTVEETIATLELNGAIASASSSINSTPVSSPSKRSGHKMHALSGAVGGGDATLLHRELPIFSNPLLANATQANSVPIKPKSGRVKVGSKSVVVLRISAPKVDGEVVVMRRMDNDLVNATSMFNAAYPAISEKMNAKENAFITRKYEGHVEKSGALSGVWITIVQARELAKEYEIDQFMRPLLEASSVKSTSSLVIDGEEIVEQVVVTEVTTVQTTTTTMQQQDIELDEATVQDTTERMQELTVADVAGMKRRIEELEDQVSRDKKKLRGLVTVAVGLAAASVIPQVLPYFS